MPSNCRLQLRATGRKDRKIVLERAQDHDSSGVSTRSARSRI